VVLGAAGGSCTSAAPPLPAAAFISETYSFCPCGAEQAVSTVSANKIFDLLCILLPAVEIVHLLLAGASKSFIVQC
jgi:hypothetical protein